MRVGHATVPLPVPDGTPMGGYAARTGPSAGVLDPLQVDCVTLAGPAGRIGLVVADVLCVNEDVAAAARHAVRRRLGPVADVWVCATHTHSGPDVGCVPGGGPTPAPWRDRIASAAAEATEAAIAAERECAGRLHAGTLRGIGSRRGVDDGVAEVGVEIVSFAGAGDAPAACSASSNGDASGAGGVDGVLAVVPVHPTVLPAGSTAVSGDLAAAIRRALQRELGAAWVVVATGAAGDISTRRTRRAQTAEECARLGGAAAAQLAALVRAPGTPLWNGGAGHCAAAIRRVDLPARDGHRNLAAVRADLQEARARELRRGGVATATARTLETALQGVDVARTQPARSTVPLVLSAARAGALALYGLGAEPFHSLAAQLRAHGPGPSLVLGYANGHAGYLTDAAAHATPGYEALSSPFRADAGATAVAALIELSPDPRRTE